MRRIATIIAIVLLSACDLMNPRKQTPPDGEAAAAARDSTGSAASAAPQDVSDDSAAAPSAASAADTAPADGPAELRKLAAAGGQVLVDGNEERVPAGELVVDTADTPAAYAGDYHFGDSEWESTLSLEVRGNAVTGTLKYAVFQNETWVAREMRLAGAAISGATLTARGWSGVFARYGGKPGLVILRSPSDRITAAEFGDKVEAAPE